MSTDKPCVLLVEDEPAQREILRYNLTSEGYDVTLAENGDDALILVDEVMPDLILLDWMLPGVSGIEICRQVKSRKETRAIPVIMLSARSEEVDRVRGLETGADDYVVKALFRGRADGPHPHPAAPDPSGVRRAETGIHRHRSGRRKPPRHAGRGAGKTGSD